MKIEIWSDVVCPFCYIGKRKLEAALLQFPERDKVEVEWKSFQLDPGMATSPDKTIYQYLSENKGMSLQEARQMTAHVGQAGAAAGLTFDFDKAVVANTFDAHRLLQLAKKHGKGNDMEEVLFNAYFTGGKNIADHDILLEAGKAAGLDRTEVKEMLKSNLYAEEVNADIAGARSVGVRGVPFFVLDNKYAISGAQDTQIFLRALEKSFAGWQEENSSIQREVEGKVCSPEGNCD
jgi:predicted DsbA family dithiol-disulfide isomerase